MQSTGVLYWASQKISERWRKKEVSIYNENPVACWMEKRSFRSMLAPTLEQTGKRRVYQLCHAPELQLHTGSFPVASRKQTQRFFLPWSKQGKRNDRCHHFQVSFRTQVTLRYVDEGMASLTFFISCIIRTVYMVVFEPHSFLLTLWKQQVRTATLARQRQVHSFRCTEPPDWNDPFNDLVKLEDKPILGDGPVGIGHSRKIVDHHSFLDLARIHLHRRTQSKNEWLQVLQPLVSTTLFCFNERTRRVHVQPCSSSRCWMSCDLNLGATPET